MDTLYKCYPQFFGKLLMRLGLMKNDGKVSIRSVFGELCEQQSNCDLCPHSRMVPYDLIG